MPKTWAKIPKTTSPSGPSGVSQVGIAFPTWLWYLWFHGDIAGSEDSLRIKFGVESNIQIAWLFEKLGSERREYAEFATYNSNMKWLKDKTWT